MINNRHGPHPAVSYYRSGAPPGCGLDRKNGASCDPRLLLEAVATHELRVASCGLRVATHELRVAAHELRVAAHDCYRGRGRGAPVIPKIRDALAALGDCFAEISKRRGLKGYAEDAKNILCPEGFVALGDSLAHFAVSKRRGHKVELDPGNHRDAENAKKNLCSEGFEALCGFLVAFVVNQFKHRVPIAFGSNEDTEDTEMNMSYGSMMT